MRNEEVAALLASTDWDDALSCFRGEIEQTPPMYSAKKVDGKKLYESARRGIEVEREPVRVTIHKLEVVEKERLRTPDPLLRIRVVCSAGTYIRTLAEDIGRAVGVGAHLAELRRTRAGRFDISQSMTLDALAAADDPGAALLPAAEAVSHLSPIILNADRVDKTMSGLSTRIEEIEFADAQPIRMHDEAGQLLAVGVYDEAEKSVRPKVVLV